MSRIIGIDLGTTNSLVATVESGFPYVIADSEGRRLTPSVVNFPDAESAPVVGIEAQRQQPVQPANTVYSIKRFMGRRGDDLAETEKQVPYSVQYEANGPVRVAVHGRLWSPEAISAEILKKVKQQAEVSLEESVDRAVVTVPAYFNDAQRNATKKAGELAGLTVERIVNEPTAAALAYGLNRLKTNAKIAVYDLGGGTFDLTVLELKEGVFQVLATCGNTRLGGDDLNRRVVEHLTKKIQEAGGPDVTSDLTQLARLHEAVETAKVRLSQELEADIALPFLSIDGFNFHYRLTREELEGLTRDIIAETRQYCARSLADAGIEGKELDQVILVGGQTRMPLVRKMVADFFSCTDFEPVHGNLRVGSEPHEADGPQLNTSQNPDEAVALGAAIQAEILSGGMKELLLLDVTPLSLGIETYGGLMNVIIPRNTTIPVKAGEMFTTAADRQQSMLIHVLQGERERAQDNWSLGRFTIEFESAPKGVPRVGVQFEIDANGILHVLARDTKSGRERVVEMKSAVDVEDTKVQEMVEESVEHAFSDLRARQWVEAKMRAQETLDATEKGLEQCPDEIDAAQRQEIDRLTREVRELLSREDPVTGAGDVDRLKEVVSRLDEVTRPLADAMMDKAMERMLREQGMIS